MILKSVGCDLAGRDLGSRLVKMDLVFYDDYRFVIGVAHASLIFFAGC